MTNAKAIARIVALSTLAGAFLVVYWDYSVSAPGLADDYESSFFSRQLGSRRRRAAVKAHKARILERQKQTHRFDSTFTGQDPVEPHGATLTTAACSPEAINKLTSTMLSDPEHMSLRPLSISVGGEGEGIHNYHFSGFDTALLHRAFLNNRIAIMGDSTLRDFSLLLAWLLRQEYEKDRPGHTSLPSMEGMTLSEANGLVGDSGDSWKQKGHKRYTKFHGNDALLYHWTVSGRYSDVLEIDILQDVIDFRPKVMLVNIGLHLLHLWNYGRDTNASESWLNYETFLEETIEAAKEAGAELLLFKTTNFVCEDKYASMWKRGGPKYRAHDEQTLTDCFATVREANLDAATVGDEDVASYCRDGPIIEYGVQKLNARLHQFVTEANNDMRGHGGAGGSLQLRIAVFNDHDLQSCETTREGDGRHHHPLNLARMRLLGNYIDCMQSLDDDIPNISSG